jgi:hypothetical protein
MAVKISVINMLRIEMGELMRIEVCRVNQWRLNEGG